MNADAEVLDWTVYTDRMRGDKGIGDLYLLGLGSRFNGPEDVSIVTTGQIWDQTYWIKETENGPKFEAMYKELSETLDEEKQHRSSTRCSSSSRRRRSGPALARAGRVGRQQADLNWEDYGGGNSFSFGRSARTRSRSSANAELGE